MQYEESKLIQKFMKENSEPFMSLEELKRGLEERKFSVENKDNSLLVTLNNRYFIIKIDQKYKNSFLILEIDENGNELIDKGDAPLVYRDSEAILLVAQVLKLCVIHTRDNIPQNQSLKDALELAQQRNPRTEKY